jgi:hypothetical protein
LIAAGVLAFVAAHIVLTAAWPAFDPARAHRAWFLNSGRAVTFTVVWMFGTGWFIGALPRSSRAHADAATSAASYAAGSVAAMIVVLFVIGPGTLFPIAVVLGAGLLAAPAMTGIIAGGRWRPR